MINMESEELEQVKLKEYLLGLKAKLLAAMNKKKSETGDHLLYNKKLHHFADKFLRSKGKQKPSVSLLADRNTVDEFIAVSNAEFRQKYSKLWAFMLHE